MCNLIIALNAAPLLRKVVDMTYTFDETTLHYPGTKGFQMKVVMNGTELNGVWVQGEEISSAIHVGTHMDAPLHFTPLGVPVDQLDIRRLVAPAAVIDITAKAELDPDADVTVEDLLHWESITGQSLNETVVFLKSGWGKKWNNQTAFFGTPDYDATKLHSPGLSPESATWLVENRNIYGLGTETVSLDKGPSQDFQVHQILLVRGIYGMENVANVDKIPIYGATVHVMPMKIGKGSGAPVRIVATYPEIIFDSMLPTNEELS
ncbi:uncharacterized protein TNIN_312601 [Trichonephila inaurata madagascariensis]|uniref:Cyclase n=1 Tax=Trichonephila inaurata madagascariensis TaxID=2747483 RepID=A0A8X6K815_9ARAC|nr:uncharacterized protein TNIN_312601 [Trichonephila inaurata madagascariensis]